ncbi:MAG: hypothetical protein LC685_02490 [Actinobacteria bacterium]|nr:hypothetical protein [Actinomycetota bacterium]
MRSFLPQPPTRRLSRLAAWAVGLTLLTPLILCAGLIAVVVLAGLTLGRRTAGAELGRRAPASALPSVLRLEPAPAEPGLVAVSRRAA